MEELLVNVTLNEMRSNRSWTNDRLFERLWSCLVNLRRQLDIDRDVPDAFGLVRSQLPPVFYLDKRRIAPSYDPILHWLVKNVGADESLVKVDDVSPVEATTNEKT